MKKTKLEKGITLVALIITIVVLLILAVVSIGAVRDSGIIGHAQNATNTQTIEQEKERINLALYEWKIQKSLSGNILTFKSVLEESLKDVASVEGSDNGPVTVTFEKSGNKYKVTESGTITKIANLQGTDLERYIFGQGLNGRELSEILDTEDYYFKDDPETEEDETETIGAEFITMAIETSEISVVYFKVNDVNYKFAGDNNTGRTDTNYGIVELEEINGTSNIGKTVSYDGKKWTVLYDDDENGLQMICNETYGEFTFNANASNFVYKYNNAITTLNNECAKLFNDEKIKAVRCVGSDPRNPTNESSDNYKSDNLKNWASGNWNDVVKDTDTNYKTDFERMVKLGIYDTGGNYYWYASRLCAYDGDNELFGIRCTVERGTYVFPVGTLNEEGISYLDGSCYLRPVITLDKDNIILFGEGTEESPYEIADKSFQNAKVWLYEVDEVSVGYFKGIIFCELDERNALVVMLAVGENGNEEKAVVRTDIMSLDEMSNTENFKDFDIKVEEELDISKCARAVTTLPIGYDSNSKTWICSHMNITTKTIEFTSDEEYKLKEHNDITVDQIYNWSKVAVEWDEII